MTSIAAIALAVPDVGLEGLHRRRVHLRRVLLGKKGFDLLAPVAEARQVLGAHVERVAAEADKAEVAAHVGVEDGHRPIRHVRDGDVVAVGHELVEHAPHRDDVVVRVRAEDEDALVGEQVFAVRDALAQVLEDLPGQIVDVVVAVNQAVELVLVVVRRLEAGIGVSSVSDSQMTARLAFWSVQSTSRTRHGIFSRVSSPAAARSR